MSDEDLYKASTAALAFLLLAVVIAWLFSRGRRPKAVAVATQTHDLSELEYLESFPVTVSGDSSSSSSSLFQSVISCLRGPGAAEASSVPASAGWISRGAAERNWLEKMILSLTKVRRAADGGIDVGTYLSAMGGIPEVYNVLLSLQVVTTFMRRDLLGHVATVRAASQQVPGNGGQTLQGIVSYALATHDRTALARSTTSMVGGVLWLNRCCGFITAFIRGLADGLPSREAAAAAYDRTLRMYHSAVTAAFVSRAMSLCPERERIIERLNLPSEEAGKQQLATFLGLMEPLVEEIRAFLTAQSANFPDRIG